MGSKQSALGVAHPINPVQSHDKPMANIMDCKPVINIKPFGQCKSLANPTVAAATAAANGKLQKMPCIPVIASPWTGGKTSVSVKGQPALMDNCKLMCTWVGKIEIANAGQKTVSDGGQAGKNTKKDAAARQETDNTNTQPSPKSETPVVIAAEEAVTGGGQVPQKPKTGAKIAIGKIAKSGAIDAAGIAAGVGRGDAESIGAKKTDKADDIDEMTEMVESVEEIEEIEDIEDIEETEENIETWTWDHHTNNRIKKLHPKIQRAVIGFINEAEETLNIQLRVSEGFRTFKEQDDLYATGRTVNPRSKTVTLTGKNKKTFCPKSPQSVKNGDSRGAATGKALSICPILR
jgi:hypothetical protein